MGISSSSPELFTGNGYSANVVNGRIEQNSFVSRWGYVTDRTLESGPVYVICKYDKIDGSRNTLYLTDTDLCAKEIGVGETYSYKTETYTDGSISGLSGDKLTVTGNGSTDFVTAGIAAGDKFIIDADHSAKVEPDANWATVASVTDLHTIVLSAAYTGSAASGSYKIRKVYSVPDNERWSWCIINDIFCFTNGDVGVHYWDGSGYATSLDEDNASKARYAIEYGNRLVLADTYISSLRRPCTLKWSDENDPTTWDGITAGENDFQDTENFITGLGKVGSSLVVYRRDNIVLGNRTGVATAPFSFPTIKKGIGCVAPYSIVDFGGTNAWLGRDDFYMMNGETPEAIGGEIRNAFFDGLGYTEMENVWGGVNYNLNEVMWVANKNDGRKVYVWNYKINQWYIYDLAINESAFGMGVIT
jgi:hypothetical protein